MHISRAQWIGLGVVAIVAATIVYTARPKPIDVDTAEVALGRLEATVDADGRTRVRDRFVVTAPVSGRVERLVHNVGDVVRRGEVIARISPLPLDSVTMAQARLRVQSADAVVLQAAAQLRVASAERDQRRRDLSRAERLHAVGAIAPSVLEEAQLASTEADEAYRAASERCRGAESDAGATRLLLAGQRSDGSAAVLVRAPTAGRVLRIPERSERIVPAGSALIEIGDPSSLEIVIDVLSSDGAMVHPGDAVRLTELSGAGADDAPAPVSGRVREIEPSGFTKVSALGVEEQRVNVIVDVTGALASIGDGFRVEARIVVWSADHVVRVPRSALVQGAHGDTTAASWSAYVVRDGRVEQRLVRIGHVGSGEAEVVAGLTAGERVVVFPSDQVRHGVRAQSRNAHGS